MKQAIILSLLFILPFLINAQQPYLEAGSGIRVGIWQYNLGQNEQGDFAGNGLHYTHFSPFFPAYIQSGIQFNNWEIGLGSSYMLFLDNEFRVHQDPGLLAPAKYAFTQSYVHLIHLYGNTSYYLINKERTKLGPAISSGHFIMLNDYPEDQLMNSRWFLEGGIKGLFKIGKLWLSIYPNYQWNTINGKETNANHQLFSFGGLVGIRKEW